MKAHALKRRGTAREKYRGQRGVGEEARGKPAGPVHTDGGSCGDE